MVKWKLLLINIFLILILGQWDIEQAWACSGGRAWIPHFLEDHDFAILAEVVEVDASGMNGLLRVESYLSGTAGPEFMMFSQFSPSETNARVDRMMWTSCDGSDIQLVKGGKVVTFVNRLMDGSYSPLVTGAQLYQPIFSFPTDAPVQVRELANSQTDDYDYLILTADEMAEMVLSFSGSQPVEPLPDHLPMQAPILIKTSTKRLYMIPIDRHTPLWLANDVQQVSAGSDRLGITTPNQLILRSRIYPQSVLIRSINADHACLQTWCVGFSSTGYRMAFLNVDDPIDRLHLVDSLYSFTDNNSFFAAMYFDPEAEGFQGFAFSPDDEAIAIWYPDQLEVKTCFTPASMFCSQSIFSLPLDFSNSPDAVLTSAGRSAWSPDSRLLAFTDENGLWLWDVYIPDSTPRLLQAADTSSNLPYAIGFSPLGRYLAIEHAGQMKFLDIVANRELPYGYFSPNEDTLIVTEPSEEERHLYELGESYSLRCNMQPLRCFSDDPIKSIVWISDTSRIGIYCYLAGTVCRFAIDDHIHVYGDELLYLDQSTYAETTWLNAINFDYEPHSNYAVLQNDAQTITLLNISNPDEHTTLNLDSYLDGEIVTVEWLPSVFYWE